MLVKDIMMRDVATVSPLATIREAMQLMRSSSDGAFGPKADPATAGLQGAPAE